MARPLPDYVQEEFDAYQCGRLEEGFLRVVCDLICVVGQSCQQLDAEHDDYREPGTDSLSHVLQSDILPA